MRRFLKALVAISLAAVPFTAQADDWKPDHPITIVVPFPPGGTADQVARLVGVEMQKALGQSFVVINQPGATGAIGARAVRDAPKDGYTWLGTANRLVGTYPIMSDVKVTLDEFNQFLAITNVPVISVATAAPYADFGQLFAALRDKPGQITVGTAGPATSGHFAMEAIAQTAHIKYRLVNYQGGAPAVMSTVSRETVVNAELASDQAEMISRQAVAAARGAERCAARAERLRNDFLDQAMDSGFARRYHAVRHSHPEGRTAERDRYHRSHLEQPDRALDGAQDLGG